MKNGYILATVLMVIFLALIAAFVFVDSSVFHLNTVQRVNNNEQARNMAESVIAMTLEKVLKDPSYGKSTSTTYNQPVPPVISNTNGNAAVGLLAFSPSNASNLENPITKGRENIPWSYNNLEVDAAKKGCGRTVPQFAIHLVGTGISNGVVRRVEAIVHVPPFPYAIASSGKFESNNGLLVAAVKEAKDAMNGASAIPPEKLVPSHLASNSRDNKAVKLGKGTKITGDVRSSGGVELDPEGGAEIQGKTICHADPINLPKIDVTSYDPEVQKMEGIQQLPASLDAQKLEGVSKRKGNLTVNGDLTLDGSIVYVEGDMTIHGGVKGKGGLFVTGKTTIDRGASLDSTNTAVVISKGDVSLGGKGKDSSAFQGLVYTEGDFKAEQITLLGAFLSNGSGEGATTQVGSTSSGNIAMNNVNLIQVSEYTKINIPVEVVKTVTTTTVTAPTYSGPVYTDNSRDGRLLSPYADTQYFVGIWPNFNIESVKDTSTDPPTYRSDWVTPNNSVLISFGTKCWSSGYWWQDCHLYNAGMSKLSTDSRFTFCYGVAKSYADAMYASTKQAVAAYNEKYQKYILSQRIDTTDSTTTKTQVGAIDIDFNKFLNFQDKMRIVLWKEWEPVKK
ncbi:MAG: hypothetical protein AB2L14_07315 [Candidatus Xenobiia bacterium LiM19]